MAAEGRVLCCLYDGDTEIKKALSYIAHVSLSCRNGIAIAFVLPHQSVCYFQQVTVIQSKDTPSLYKIEIAVDDIKCMAF